MYGAIWPGLRASTRRPPRFIHGRRYPLSHRTRSFHSTCRLAHEPTPPVGPDSKPVDDNGADKKMSDKAAAEHVDAGVATEDPEVLAQKLQRSREAARRYSSALRRSQRRNRAQDMPPVVVPDWFLNDRVVLREEAGRKGHHCLKRGFTVSFQSHGSEKASKCSIPLGYPSESLKIINRWAWSAWESRLSTEQRTRFAKQLALQLGVGGNERMVQALERGENLTAVDEQLRGELLARLEPYKRSVAEARALMDESNNERVREISKTLQRQEIELAQLQRESDALMKQAKRRKSELSPLVLAEIRSTIAASLSALQPASSDTFPSAKTNLILHSPFSELEEALEAGVMSIAAEFGSDVIVLQAQDLAQIAGDYLGAGLEPSPNSIRSLGYETYRLSSNLGDEIEEFGKDDSLADDQEDASNVSSPFPPMRPQMPISIVALSPAFKAITQSLKSLQIPTQDSSSSLNEPLARAQTQGEAQLEDLKIATLLETLLDSAETKRSRSSFEPNDFTHPSQVNASKSASPSFFDFSMAPAGDPINLSTALPADATSRFGFTVNMDASPKSPMPSRKSKIIYIKDIKELNATPYGGRIIQKLEEIVRRQRNAGESIMIVGSTCSLDLTPELSMNGVQSLQAEGETGFFRTIVVPAGLPESGHESSMPPSPAERLSVTLPRMSSSAEKKKFQHINLRHMEDMLRCLDSGAATQISSRGEMSSTESRATMALFPKSFSWKVLNYDEVHRIALVTLGLHVLDATSETLSWTHVALAMGLLKASDEAKFDYVHRKAEEQKPIRNDEHREKGASRKGETEVAASQLGPGFASRRDRERQLEAVLATATKHEKRLMPGIANPDRIKTTFDQVHVPRETVDSIRTLTSMSFLRPDAFNYGVLATEKISGALLYGPPGTGKTLLAKAVAKESGCTMLEVSGSQIMDKYVGEGEKNVAAIFSLARKLTPCIVFLDEADAILSSRDVERSRTSHRDILNQFLKEWDGLNDLSVFVMVATNRPFDLDDAVIRRLPRRLLVDLPTQADRAEILKIHLRGEQLDHSVNLEELSKNTPFYSGSDLKNLAVSTALACVKEENENAAIAAAKASSSETSSSLPQLVRGQTYTFPEKRTLTSQHFEKALQEISASISEDMSSLNAIKKWDEKYGDKKGKRKKRVFGIGINKETNDDVVRVRT